MKSEAALDLLEKAGVAENGAVLLGSWVACDSHAERPVRVITHAHWDHILDLERSIAACETILMTPATRDILAVIRGRRLLSCKNIQTLAYMTPFYHSGESITLYQAGHIPGSAQVMLQTQDGTKVTYTGDFKLPRAPILPTDILVMEATYGNPAHVRRFEQNVEADLVFLIEQLVATSPVFILGYHGKLQEVLELLSKAKISVPVILQEKTYTMARVLEKHGFKFRPYDLAMRGSLSSKKPFVALFHMRARKELPREAVKVFLSGWQFEKSILSKSPNEYVVAFSNHSDFQGLMEYVEKSRPKLVITDGYRAGNAETLAAQIEARLGITAQAMP